MIRIFRFNFHWPRTATYLEFFVDTVQVLAALNAWRDELLLDSVNPVMDEYSETIKKELNVIQQTIFLIEGYDITMAEIRSIAADWSKK